MQADRYRLVPHVFDICRERVIRGACNAGSVLAKADLREASVFGVLLERDMRNQPMELIRIVLTDAGERGCDIRSMM